MRSWLLTLLLVVFPHHLSAEEDEDLVRVAEIEDEETRSLRAIDRGLEFLLGEVEQEQRFREGNEGVGQVAFETYALIVAGLSVDHAVIRNNFAWLKEQVAAVRWTYATSCYIFALDAAIAQLESDVMISEPKASKLEVLNHPSIGKKYRAELRSAVEHLLAAQTATGSWSYTKQDARLDNSNSQFALLALGVGAKRGVRISSKAWKRSLEHFLSCQEKSGPIVNQRVRVHGDDSHRDDVEFVHKESDTEKADKKDNNPGSRGTTVVKKQNSKRPTLPILGSEDFDLYARGWKYNQEDTRKIDWNMTCAGVSSVLILRDNMRLNSKRKSHVDQSLWDGIGWLLKNWNINQSYYGLYSLEKVADIAGIERFGDHDWYQQVSSRLMSRQEDDGGWPKGSGHGENRRVTTGFSLLILTRASALLTSNPASRMIVFTGGQKEEHTEYRQNWAYLPERGTYVHVPSLVRIIRLRPNVRLMRILASVAEVAEGRERADLVPPLSELHSGLALKSARKLVGEILENIVGAPLTTKEYQEWYQAYRQVSELAEERDARDVPKLTALHDMYTASPLLLTHIIHALVQCEAKAATPSFLTDLDHEAASVRAAAYGAIRALFTGTPPPFDSLAPARERHEAIVAIRDWVASQ